MTARISSWFVFVVAVLATTPALAATSAIKLSSGWNAVARPRLGLGWVLGEALESDLVVHGQKQGDEGEALGTGVALSYAQGFLPYVGIVAISRYGTQPTDWSDKRGEHRTRLDLAFGPEFTLSGTTYHAQFDFRLAVPVGPTWAWIHRNDLLGVSDRYSTGKGLVLNVIAGFDVFWQHQGVFTELGYVRQFSKFTHHATLDADPTTRVKDYYRYDQQSVVMVLGYAYRF